MLQMNSMEIDHRGEEIFKYNDPQDIISQLINFDSKNLNEETIKSLEVGILIFASKLSEKGQTKELANLIRYIRPFLSVISKAKAAKLVQNLIDKFIKINASIGIEVELCKECIDWAKSQKRIFLRQRLESKLVAVYYENKSYDEALKLSSPLLKELKKMDDKHLLVEVLLIESKIFYSLGNLPKSRASLTSARTTANGIYCPPKMQSTLDLQSGVIHASEDKDFKTAYSYFYEAFEGFESCGFEYNAQTIMALKYMLLAKIILNNPDEVESQISSKFSRYGGNDLEAIRAIALASKNRSLFQFEKARKDFKTELISDPIVKMLLDLLYERLFEQNMLRIIEPYTRVQINYIAKAIQMPRDVVEKKLSQMILDEKFNGIIDQSDDGVLIIFAVATPDRTFDTAIIIIECMSKVMDTLHVKAEKLN